MASKREQVLAAIEAMVRAALPSADIERNRSKASSVQAGGCVIIRDGDPGEPEVTLCPVQYSYAHMVVLEVAAHATTAEARMAALDDMLTAIGARIEIDRTLGGLLEWLEPQAPTPDDIETAGAVSVRWTDLPIIAHYTTSNPLT